MPQTADADYTAGVGEPGTSGNSVGNNGLVVISYSASSKTLEKTSDYTIEHVSDTEVKVTKTSAGSADVKVRILA